MEETIQILYAAVHTAYSILENGEDQNYISEILGSKDFVVFYYENCKQFYCLTSTISFDTPTPAQLLGLIRFPENGWFETPFFLSKKELYSFFPYSLTKRIKAKHIISLDGSSKHSHNCGSGSSAD